METLGRRPFSFHKNRDNTTLYASDDLGALGFELGGVAGVGLRFAVFEAAALVILQQTVLAAEVALAEAAVANNELGSFAALGGVATDLLSSHGGRW